MSRLGHWLPLAVLAALTGTSGAEPIVPPRPAPPFPTVDPAHWVGTPPTWDSLRGKVVLIDVWTFG